MRTAIFIAAALSLCLLGTAAAKAGELDAKANGAPAAAAPAPAGADAKAGDDAGAAEPNEFDGVDIDAIKKKNAEGGGAAGGDGGGGADNGGFDMSEFSGAAGGGTPPSEDTSISTAEYNDVPVSLMIPAQQVAAGNAGPGSTLHGGSSKMTYETMMKVYRTGGDENYKQIAPELESLAKGGHHGAQELIGIMYRLGQGVQKDPKKAFEYLSQAADNNRPLAQHHLGIMYFNGEGVPADSVMALMWLQIAIVHYDDGDEKNHAQQDRDNMYTHLTRREKDRALQYARDWLNKRGEAHLLDLEGL